MKSILLSVTMWALALSAWAQQAEMAMYYSLPRTRLCIQIEIERTVRKPGPFYRYSERYLATTNVITAEKTEYKLKSVLVSSQALPDSSRTYTVSTEKDPLNIVVTPEGLLCGVNVAATSISKPVLQTKDFADQYEGPRLLPLTEEFMLAGSEAKMAEGAAKQIYHLREGRLGLLAADVEKMPSDGVALKTMLEGLDRSERSLTELFIGSTTTDTQFRTLYFTPNQMVNNMVLFRVSSLRGLVAASDLSGAPYYLSLLSPVMSVMPPRDSKKEQKDPTALYYLQPAMATVQITDGLNVLTKSDLFVAQLGKVLALPQSLFKENKTKIQIDPETGRLLSLDK